MSSVNLDSLPVEVVQNVLQWLPPGQLCGLTINRYLYDVASSDVLWQELCLARKIEPLQGKSFKQAFMEYSEGFYRYFEALFTAQGISLPKSTAERKTVIDKKIKELDSLPNLAEAIATKTSVSEVHYLIEAGALDRSAEKERILRTAIYEYPPETLDLLAAKGAPVTEQVICDIILSYKEFPSVLLKKFLIEFLKNNRSFSSETVSYIFRGQSQYSDDCIFLVLDHCEVIEEHLKMALLFGASDHVITKLVTKGGWLSLDLLKNAFINRIDLFFRLYAQSNLPITADFKKEFIKCLNIERITLATFHLVVDSMVLAGVKFSEAELVSATGGKEIFKEEALNRMVRHCEANRTSFLKEAIAWPALNLKSLFAESVHRDANLPWGALLLSLKSEMMEYVAHLIEFDRIEEMLLNQFEPFLSALKKMHQEGDLNDSERLCIKAKINEVSYLLSRLKQETVSQDVKQRFQCYRDITHDLQDHLSEFFEEVLAAGDIKFPFLYQIASKEVIKAGNILLGIAIGLKKPTQCFATFLKAGAVLKDLSWLILAAQLELPSEIIEMLIRALAEVSLFTKHQLLSLQTLLSLDHLIMLVKRFKHILPALVKNSIFTQDHVTLHALIKAGAAITPKNLKVALYKQDRLTLQVLIETGMQRISQKNLQRAIFMKVDIGLFETLLDAAEPNISLNNLLQVAIAARNEAITHVIETKMSRN